MACGILTKSNSTNTGTEQKKTSLDTLDKAEKLQ